MFHFIARLFHRLRRKISPPLTEFFEQRYVPQRLLDCSVKTIAVYRVTLTFFGKFTGDTPKLADLNDHTISAFAKWRLEDVSKGTVKRDMDCLLAIWRFARDAGLLKRGPMIRPIHAPTPTPVAPTREQADAIWEAMNTEERPVLISCNPRIEVPGNVWWPAIYLLCMDTAERISPIFYLYENQIDLVNLWVRFPAESRKGKIEDNVKPIHQDTADAIRLLLSYYPKRQGNSRVFRWASNDGTIWPRLGAIMERAGLPNTREFKFQSVRKFSVSHVIAAGGNGSEHAGHRNPVVTKVHYDVPEITRSGAKNLRLVPRPGHSTS